MPGPEPTPPTLSGADLLGEMVWLFSMSHIHRGWTIGSIHQWILPAIRTAQFRLYHRDGRPVGLVTWAWLSAEVETAYVHNPSGLSPADWQSGDRCWILDFIAPFGDANRIVRNLRNEVFANDVGRFLRVKEGSDTMKIMYVHGRNAVSKARNRSASPTVQLRKT